MSSYPCWTCRKCTEDKWCVECHYEPKISADVRKNIHAQKVIGGGEHDGATCWFECSHCHGTVDLQDMFCKHCGAVLEEENGHERH